MVVLFAEQLIKVSGSLGLGPELSTVLSKKVGEETPASNNQREHTVRRERVVLMGYYVKMNSQ